MDDLSRFCHLNSDCPDQGRQGGENLSVCGHLLYCHSERKGTPLGGTVSAPIRPIGAKAGTKRNLIVDGQGGPLGVVVAGANVNDHTLLAATIEAVVVERPGPEPVEQHLCLDRGYDNEPSHEVVEQRRSVDHIRPIGEDRRAARQPGRRQPRRWVVERTIGWLNKCRALPVQYDKEAQNYLGLIQLACGLLWFRRLHRRGAT